MRLDRSAYDALGIDSITPEPAAVRSHGDMIEVEFEATGPGVARVDLVGRVPTQQAPGKTDWHLVSVAGERELAVDVTTWVLP